MDRVPADPLLLIAGLALYTIPNLTPGGVGVGASLSVAGDALRVIGNLLYLGGIVASYLLSGTILYRW